MLDLRIQMTINYVNVLNAAVETLGVPLTNRYYGKDIESFLALLIANAEVVDGFNNIGRYCSLPNDIKNRRNKVEMRVMFQRWVATNDGMKLINEEGYLVRNVDTNKVRVTLSTWMFNVY